jgi:general stress protein 26
MSQVTEGAIKDLRSKISSIRFGMLTTSNDDQSLSSRPMTQQALEDSGILWFFISDTSQLATDINRHPKINVTFANPSDSVYVAISGHAEVIKFKEKAAELWNPAVAAWFPDGLEDPHLSLIKVSIYNAEYWDSHTNKMLRIFSIAKAAIIGEPPTDIGDHQKIDFK